MRGNNQSFAPKQPIIRKPSPGANSAVLLAYVLMPARDVKRRENVSRYDMPLILPNCNWRGMLMMGEQNSPTKKAQANGFCSRYLIGTARLRPVVVVVRDRRAKPPVNAEPGDFIVCAKCSDIELLVAKSCATATRNRSSGIPTRLADVDAQTPPAKVIHAADATGAAVESAMGSAMGDLVLQ